MWLSSQSNNSFFFFFFSFNERAWRGWHTAARCSGSRWMGSSTKQFGSLREAPRLSPAGNPSSRAAHGCSPTARGERGGSGVVKQVIQEGREGPAGDTMPSLIAPFDSWHRSHEPLVRPAVCRVCLSGGSCSTTCDTLMFFVCFFLFFLFFLFCSFFFTGGFCWQDEFLGLKKSDKIA